MNTALVSGLIILVLLIIMLIAGVPIAVALGVSSVCNSSNHGFECSRTDRMPENLLRYLCIQPACYPVLYSCRKYYE